MFDKLIESNTAGAEFKPRRKFFMMSSVVVGILFVTAVVVSLFAADIDIGNAEFDMSVLQAQITTNEPEPSEPRHAASQDQTTSERTTRQANIARIDEQQDAPTTISSVPNTQASRPTTDYDIGRFDRDPAITSGSGAGQINGNGPAITGSPSGDSEVAITTPERKPEPPPIENKKPATQSLGVINGKATYLPRPPYPAPARMVGAEGAVNVQVTIDENGKVISSRAVSGHPLLKQAAERAAWNAKFSTTYLSHVPVKVTGVIVYKFSRN